VPRRLAIAVGLLAGLTAMAAAPFEMAATDSVAAGRVTPKNGLYRGKTAQGNQVSFRVVGGKVTRPSYTVAKRGCGVRITFTATRRVNGKSRFFFGSRSSDFLGGRFVAPGKVRGRAGIDFSASSCPGSGVQEVRFRARRISR
jgi:hypothetical protein